MSGCANYERCWLFFFFFFNDTATTEIYTLSLHDALPILGVAYQNGDGVDRSYRWAKHWYTAAAEDRKSTRLNSSHSSISYAVFCLKKKKNKKTIEAGPTNEFAQQ